MQTLSTAKGIGGTIKAAADDFCVEEITKTGVVLETGRSYTPEELGIEKGGTDSKFTVFVMQKRDWNTLQALKEIGAKCGRGMKSTNFAGTKDRTSVSTQLCSIFGAKPETVMGVHVKDIQINGAWPSDNKVELGGLLGNRFTIKVTDVRNPGNVDLIDRELCGIFPNYYGSQRFGTRDNNVDIGVDMLKGDFKSAAMRFLTDTTNESNEEAINARIRLKDDEDFVEALEYFPRHLKYERMLLNSLAEVDTDFGRAIRKLPRTLSLMFIHSVESYIFNKEVELRVKERRVEPEGDGRACTADRFGFPDLDVDASSTEKKFIVGNTVGYDTLLNATQEKLLGELGIAQEQFRMKSMPELNSKGSRRVLFAPYVEFAAQVNGSEVTLRFSLPAGSYATVLLGEFIKA